MKKKKKRKRLLREKMPDLILFPLPWSSMFQFFWLVVLLSNAIFNDHACMTRPWFHHNTCETGHWDNRFYLSSCFSFLYCTHCTFSNTKSVLSGCMHANPTCLRTLFLKTLLFYLFSVLGTCLATCPSCPGILKS
jgi:hypothetical protein